MGTLGCVTERSERGLPELLEIGAYGGEPVRVDGVDAPVALRPVPHEFRLLQDLEVLADRGSAHRTRNGQVTGDLGDRHRAAGYELEDRSSGGVRESGENEPLVSHDLP